MTLYGKRLFLQIAGILALIMGIAMILTFVGVILGIFYIVAYKKISSIYSASDNEMQFMLKEKIHIGWAIFLAVSMGLFGIMALIPFVVVTQKEETDLSKQEKVIVSESKTEEN